MRPSEKNHLKKVLDQIEVEKPTANFEQRIYQDWQRAVTQVEKPAHRFSEVLVLVKMRPKRLVLLAIIAITASVLLGQQIIVSQDEELHRIDTLSELSLSTI